MKPIVVLIVMAVMLSGVMVGCKASPEEEVYRDVSVGPMTVSIPSEWERPEEYEEIVEEATSEWEAEFVQTLQIDYY